MKTTIKAYQLTKTFQLSRPHSALKENSTGQLIALNNLSFEIFEGDCVGVVGGNGSGKSTLLKSLRSNAELLCAKI
jgi:lipopolysaccharide transport system ATP-binding protein